MRRRAASVLAAFVLTAGGLGESGRARAEWQVKRSELAPQIVERLKQLLAANPDDSYAYKKLVGLYRQHRSIAALVAEYTPKPGRRATAAQLVVLGHLARDQGDAAGAVRRYEEALTVEGAAPAVALAAERGLAEALEKSGRRADARARWAAVLARTNDVKQKKALHRKLADLALDPTVGLDPDAALAEARKQFDALLRLDAGDRDARRELAELLAARGRPKDAAAEWRRIADGLGRDPGQRAQALRRAGELEEAAGEVDAAIATYRQVYAAVPRGHALRREAIDRLVAAHRKKDRLRELLATWEREWPVGERGFAEHDALARLADELGDSERAAEGFRRALAADPHAIDARRRLIALYERAGRDADVLAETRRLVSTAPGEPRFRIELAERLYRTPDGRKEAIAIAEGVAQSSRDTALLGAIAELYQRWGLADRALAIRERLVRIEPNEEAHIVNLGELHFARGEKEKAREVWRRLLKTGRREQALGKLADVLVEHDLSAEALALYDEALRAAGTSDGALVLQLMRGRAGALERLKRDADAERAYGELFEAAAAARTGEARAVLAEAQKRLIAVLARRGRLAERTATFRARFDAADGDAALAAWGILVADAYGKLGRHADAVEVLGKLVERARAPGVRAEAEIAVAHIHRARRNVKEAIAALERAATLAPERARELYAQIAELSLALYRDADALAYAQRAIDLGPNDAQAQLRLAEVYERRDQIDEAVAAYRRALQLNDRQWKTHFTLARLLLRRGEPAEAAALYRDVIRRASEEELVLEAARHAIDLEEYLGRLGELERELAPLSYLHADKRVYRNLLLELYERYAMPLVVRARRGDEGARAELRRIGETAVRPLLDSLVDGDTRERKLAVTLLGELGNTTAALPLLKVAAPRLVAADGRRPAKGDADRGKRTSEPLRLGDLRNPFAGGPGGGVAGGVGGVAGGVVGGAVGGGARGGTAFGTLSFGSSLSRGEARALVELRTEAALAAARVASAKEIPQLVALARDDEKHLRLAGLLGLARLGGPAAEAALTRALGDGSPDVVAVAALGLGRLGVTRAAGELTRVVVDPGRRPLARAGAAQALGLLAIADGGRLAPADRAAAEAALIAALDDGGEDLARKAAWALGRLGGRAARGALLQATFVRRDEVRTAAVEALAASARASEADAPPLPPFDPPRGADGLDVRAFVVAFGRPAPDATIDVPPAAWRGAAPEVEAALREALSRHRDLALRTLADLAAGPGGPDGGIALGPLTPPPPPSSSSSKRAPIAPEDRAILDGIAAALRPHIERLARDGDLAVRAAALEVLARTPSASAVVLAATSDPSADIRMAALAALAEPRDLPTASTAILGALQRSLRAPGWRERLRAASSLGRLLPLAEQRGLVGGAGAPLIAALSDALADPHGLVREAAAAALGTLGATAVAPLARRAADPAAEVRAAVARALGATGAPAASATVDALARDPHPAVRAAAVEAQRALGAAPARPSDGSL
jgi:tetratricopeptide (TPR) repeat protein